MIEFHYVILFAYLICTNRCILLYALGKLSLLHYPVRSVNVIMQVRMAFYRSMNISLHIYTMVNTNRVDFTVILLEIQ